MIRFPILSNIIIEAVKVVNPKLQVLNPKIILIIYDAQNDKTTNDNDTEVIINNNPISATINLLIFFIVIN